MAEEKDMFEGGEHLPHHDLLELFDELTFRQKVRKVIYGLGQPKDSGDYKWAKLQLLRLSAPVSAVLIPLLFMGLLMTFAGMTHTKQREVQVTIKDPEPVEDLDKIEDIMDEPVEPPPPIEMDFTPDAAANVSMDSPLPAAPEVEVSAKPAQFDSVAMVKSPVIMRGIIGNRSGGARGAALAEYGGSGVTEGAVIRALRWLKKNQNPDGSWPKNKPAMTALSLLTFLAHGETPASDEFGETVQKAIKYLVDHRDSQGGWPRSYQHAIATYAICEAYALTKIPMLEDVAYKAIDIIIKGQNPTGGWRYKLKPPEQDDTSCMGWCAQALKAAKMAHIPHPQLKSSIRLAIKGFKKNADPRGGFGYTGPGRTGLTGTGVLCMQLLGAAREPEVKKGLEFLKDWTYSWSNPQGTSPIYYWYYITQAKFHAGGGTWTKWNKMFAMELVRNQQVIKKAIPDTTGKMRDIGFWDSPSPTEHHDGRVMDTCLSALQLQVYYRYLPTYKPIKDTEEPDDIARDEGDIKVDIDI